METKELKIQAPEGYEIDKENSTFECIRFKPIKKDITYDDICNILFVNDTYFISDKGLIIKKDEWANKINLEKNNSTNIKQLKRLLALNQLLNIAEYYNRNTAELNARYRICYDSTNYYKVVPYASCSFTYSLEALFNNEEDALAVIDNPNFREILDTLYKD